MEWKIYSLQLVKLSMTTYSKLNIYAYIHSIYKWVYLCRYIHTHTHKNSVTFLPLSLGTDCLGSLGWCLCLLLCLDLLFSYFLVLYQQTILWVSVLTWWSMLVWLLPSMNPLMSIKVISFATIDQSSGLSIWTFCPDWLQ